MSSHPLDHPYQAHRIWLLQHARHALNYGVKHGHAPDITLDGLDPLLREKRATFITLEKSARLRGCIGHLEAMDPLVIDIARNTVSAALEDPRFSPVTLPEVKDIRIAISILTPAQEMKISSEPELLDKLKPNVDGLILQEGRRRATFLPSVWEELSDPSDFIHHLKMKAGWSAHYWSPNIKAFRYQSIYLTEDE